MADPRPANSKQNEDATRSPSGADLLSLLLLILFGFGVWAVVERGLTELLRSREPNEQKILDAHGVTRRKAEVANVKNETTEVQKYLNAARLEHLKQNAIVQSYVAAYPDLAGTSSGNVPPEIFRAYKEAQRQQHSSIFVINSLEIRLVNLVQQAESLTFELEQKSGPAESQFRWASFGYAIAKRGGTFIITLAVVAGLLSLVRMALWKLSAKKRMSTVEGFRPFELAFAILVLLFAYDQFSFAGAALVGVLLLLFILKRIKWPQKSGAALK